MTIALELSIYIYICIYICICIYIDRRTTHWECMELTSTNFKIARFNGILNGTIQSELGFEKESVGGCLIGSVHQRGSQHAPLRRSPMLSCRVRSHISVTICGCAAPVLPPIDITSIRTFLPSRSTLFCSELDLGEFHDYYLIV